MRWPLLFLSGLKCSERLTALQTEVHFLEAALSRHLTRACSCLTNAEHFTALADYSNDAAIGQATSSGVAFSNG